MFTTDEDILERVSRFDKTFEVDLIEYGFDNDDEDGERPPTGEKPHEDDVSHSFRLHFTT